MGITPCCIWMGYPQSGLDRGTSYFDWMGVPPDQDWMDVPLYQDWMGVTSPVKTGWGNPQSGLDICTPYWDRMGVPCQLRLDGVTSHETAEEQLLAPWQVVCFLCSCSRIFLFGNCFRMIPMCNFRTHGKFVVNLLNILVMLSQQADWLFWSQ